VRTEALNHVSNDALFDLTEYSDHNAGVQSDDSIGSNIAGDRERALYQIRLGQRVLCAQDAVAKSPPAQ
jgi:hypothetical protein